jgi:hypothetical protein
MTKTKGENALQQLAHLFSRGIDALGNVFEFYENTISDDAPSPEEKKKLMTLDSRFNFASADAGAKILTTNPGAKYANSVLRKDQERYNEICGMISEICYL